MFPPLSQGITIELLEIISQGQTLVESRSNINFAKDIWGHSFMTHTTVGKVNEPISNINESHNTVAIHDLIILNEGCRLKRYKACIC